MQIILDKSCILDRFISIPTRTATRKLCRIYPILIFLFFISFFNSGCFAPEKIQPVITVTIQVDGDMKRVSILPGLTVKQAIEHSVIRLNPLDRVEPPLNTVLTDQENAKIIRVVEDTVKREVIIPYKNQIIFNDTFTEGDTRIIQPGQNGREQVTIRRVLEDGVEVAYEVIKSEVSVESIPEITMVGVEKPFSPLAIDGRLVYLTGGNIWLIEGSTANRRPLFTGGDADGRVFTLSPDSSWLLFTRKTSTSDSSTINTLWVASVGEIAPRLIGLNVKNVVRYAGWMPSMDYAVTYSTVDPKPAEPGYQARNDLQIVTFSPLGEVTEHRVLIEANLGGVYGWWGSSFSWSPNGDQLIYARPEGIGIIDWATRDHQIFLPTLPYQTQGNWAWIPNFAWTNAENTIYITAHSDDSEINSDESSPWFDLAVWDEKFENPKILVPRVGMFAFPAVSPKVNSSDFLVAFLQASIPERSVDSLYYLGVMDRDGSNQRIIFPPKETSGMEPNPVIWSPEPRERSNLVIAVIFQGNLWLVDPFGGTHHQVTSDNLITRMDWK